VTGFIGRGLFFLQPGQLGFQVAYPLAETVQLGGHALVRPADVAQESLRHDGSLPPCFTAGATASMPSRAVANQVHGPWRRDGDVHAVFIAAARRFHARGRQWSVLAASRRSPGSGQRTVSLTINHDDAASWWSRPRRCAIVVVARGATW
jgi:hypothetical protein